MRPSLPVVALLVVVQAAAAMADEDCFAPMDDWRPRDAVTRMAEERGWTVRRIKIDDGCYAIDGVDAEGRRIEATVHPATLEVIEIGVEDDDDVGSRKDRKGGDHD